MALRTPPSWLQNGSHSAENDRLTNQAIWKSTGIVNPSDLQITQNGTPNMTVNIGSGWAAIVGNYQSNMGVYMAYNDATVNATITTANASNPRIDLVCLTVSDAYYTGSTNTVAVNIVAGTPASSPTVPSTPTNSIALGQVYVGAGVTSILTANITNYNVLASSIVPANVAGKNKIINGDFGIWQRGTSVALGGSNTFTADRWGGLTPFGDSVTASQQTFTAGTAPVSGYEGTYFLRFTRASGTGGYYFSQKIESCRTFAGQTVTVSFWAKASVAFTPTNIYLQQDFGTGGSSAVGTNATGLQAITTSWARYSYTIAVPSIAGKTIGAGDDLQLIFNVNPGTASSTVDIWGVQVEAGSVATPFTTATGTLQGELSAAQRYYAKSYPQATAPQTNSTTNGLIAFPSVAAVNGGIWTTVKLPTTMRTPPTVTIYSYANSTAGVMSQESSGSDFATNSGLATQIGDSSFVAYNGSGSSITPTNGGMFHYVATAEL